MLPAGRRRRSTAERKRARKGAKAGPRRGFPDEHARRFSARHGRRPRLCRRHRFGHHHLADGVGVQVLCRSW